MTREEAIKVIKNHLEHWKRLVRGKVCDETEGAETISAFEVAIQALSQEPIKYWIDHNGHVAPIQQPSVTQKSGKWDRSCTCSVCGQWRILESEKNSGKYKFCPNCGAKMESGE